MLPGSKSLYMSTIHMAKYGNHGIYRILIPCPIPPFDDNDSAMVVVVSYPTFPLFHFCSL